MHTSATNAASPARTSTRVARERLRRRYEAWEAQIQQFLRRVTEERRRSPSVRSLVERCAAIKRRIAEWKGSNGGRRRLEREWHRLKREWSEILDVVGIA